MVLKKVHITKNIKRVIVLALLFVIFLQVGYLILVFNDINISGARNKTYTVTLTKEGFSPKNITLTKGDTILFKTSNNKDFWPASDFHPVHTLYPEFDPKKPIPPEDTWSFTFKKEGMWGFHDHLNAYFTGRIKVGDVQEVDIEGKKKECLSTKGKEGEKCWEVLIDLVLKKKGLNDAFDTLNLLFSKGNPDSVDCHGLMHELGAKAYQLYSQHKAFKLTPKTSYCGYGFYHGFMEAFLHTSNNPQDARSFCEYVQKTLEKESRDAGGACYHGIGHGAVEDIPDPQLWGKPQAIINKGLDLCNLVANTPDVLKRCARGVYNAYEILASAKKYNLSLDKNDPFKICKVQEEQYRDSCYSQLSIVPLRWSHEDYYKAIKYIDAISDDSNAREAFKSIIVERARTSPQDMKGTIALCKSISPRLQNQCIDLAGQGYLKYGPPQKEYIGAIKFCGFPSLLESEKITCFEGVLSLLRTWYTVEKAQQICKSVDKKYQWNNCKYRK